MTPKACREHCLEYIMHTDLNLLFLCWIWTFKFENLMVNTHTVETMDLYCSLGPEFRLRGDCYTCICLTGAEICSLDMLSWEGMQIKLGNKADYHFLISLIAQMLYDAIW